MPTAKKTAKASSAPVRAPRKTPSIKVDKELATADSIAAAREALSEVTRENTIGDFIGLSMEGERVGTLRFACLLPGYIGWSWAVTVARLPRGKQVTVNETELLPQDDALLSPQWVPWADRLQPGDLGPSDVLPHIADDDRLVQGYEATGDGDADRVAIVELGLGRTRVLSPFGRSDAAKRWYKGVHGPKTKEATKSVAPCATCGFLTPMAGSLRTMFGVCTNEWSAMDGQVVSFDHGCGAHSETDVTVAASEWPGSAPVLDDSEVVMVDIEKVSEAGDEAE